MGFIKNLKIREKLLLLLVVLLLPLLLFLLSGLTREIREKEELETVLSKLKESEVLSGVLHEIQKERSLSSTYDASQGRVFLNELQQQRQNTDLVINRLSQFQQKNQALANDLQLLNELPGFRRQVDQLSLDSTRYESFNLILRKKLITRIQSNASAIDDADVRNQLITYAYLVDAKVNLGLLRTLLVKSFTTKSFSINEYGDFKSIKAFFDENIRKFSESASPQILSVYQRQLGKRNYQDVTTLLSTIDLQPTIDLTRFKSENWFAKFSEASDQLREVEKASITETINVTSESIAYKNRAFFLYISVVLLLLFLSILISYYTVTTISGSLQLLKLASDKVSSGYTDVVIDIQSRDEVGQLADSFRRLISKNIALTQVAEAIGEGRYDVEIDAKREGDVLANALQQMKHKLQSFSIENKNRQWYLNGLSELNTVMSGAGDIEVVSQRIIHYLVGYTQADVGAVYLLDEYENLNFAAGYAIGVKKEQLPSFKVGQGVIGQAALSNEVVVLKDVAAEYLVIKTATARIVPQDLILVPCYFEQELTGVLELVSRKEFTPQAIDLLKAASEKIAIVMHSLKVHTRTQELLYETQNQAEELETQQEELRQVNIELKTQREQLLASEEELKVNQEELEEKNSELEEKTQQLEEQFEALRVKNKEIELARQAIELKVQQVETVSRYKSDFLANMSHELRTPLNSILILSRLLADNMANTLTPKQQEQAEIIHNSGSDLLKLINEILDLSKIESGQITLEVKELNPRSMQMRSLFDQVARQKNIEFVTLFADDLPPVMSTDQFRLEQILKNLLSNAFKFTPESGTVTYQVYPVRKAIPFANAALRNGGEVIAFSVKDTGIGIPKEKQQLVFEAFQQADTSTTRKYGGTGLGLAISRELAFLLGGEIQLESAENQGSTFTLYLPQGYRPKAADAYQSPAIAIVAPENGHARSKETQSALIAPLPTMTEVIEQVNPTKKEKAVLIIEDDKGFSQIVADFAMHKEFNVYQAYTGQEGLDLLHQHYLDAILLDINLPDMSGWDILQHINDDPRLKHIKVHVMSAYDKEMFADKIDHEDYISKPVTLETLDKAFGKIRAQGRIIQTVLVVEDHEAENWAIKELLQAHDIASISAFSGQEANELLEKNRVDCIILDLNLPDTGGYELMESIRASDKNLPIIIYSGKDLSEEEEFRLKKYANTIIIKNEFSYIRLLDEVQLFLHKVNDRLPSEQEFKMKLHISEEVLKDKKVLIVDDDVRNVYSLYNLLEQYQMKIVVANDGKEALEKVETEPGIDIVLMDIMMPEMDGIEATQRIRKNPAFAKLPIVALTAKAMKGDKEKCIQAGASDYISKPIDVNKLLALMRVWLYKGI